LSKSCVFRAPLQFSRLSGDIAKTHVNRIGSRWLTPVGMKGTQMICTAAQHFSGVLISRLTKLRITRYTLHALRSICSGVHWINALLLCAAHADRQHTVLHALPEDPSQVLMSYFTLKRPRTPL
jgi:hypothetical protein